MSVSRSLLSGNVQIVERQAQASAERDFEATAPKSKPYAVATRHDAAGSSVTAPWQAIDDARPRAADLREANRQATARSMTPDQVEALLEERESLLERKYADGLSSREETRLTYVRWQLYRYDDVLSGQHIDDLETVVRAHERLAEVVRYYAAATAEAATQKPGKKT